MTRKTEDMRDIMVWLDGEGGEITGIIPEHTY
jgi:hypothetical protein